MRGTFKLRLIWVDVAPSLASTGIFPLVSKSSSFLTVCYQKWELIES